MEKTINDTNSSLDQVFGRYSLKDAHCNNDKCERTEESESREEVEEGRKEDGMKRSKIIRLSQ